MKVHKFGAVWCNGCLVMKPRWAEIEAEMPWLETEYHDFDQNKQAVEQFAINEQLPTFVFVDKNGQEILRLSGEVDKAKLVEVINENKDR